MLTRVHGSRSFLYRFTVFALPQRWPTYPDTATVSPVSDLTSGSTAFAGSSQ